MATILLKRGSIANINNASLQEGEFAVAYNDEKNKAEFYVGDGKGGRILINPDAAAQIAQAVSQANEYTDTKTADLMKNTDTIDGGIF